MRGFFKWCFRLSLFPSLPGDNHLLELHKVDFPVPVGVRVPDHLLRLLPTEVLAQGRQNADQFLQRDVAIAIGVEGSANEIKEKLAKK